MKHISYVLQDEYDNLLLQKQQLEKQYLEQSKRKRESCEQWAETRHDNADYEDAEYQQNLLWKRISDINTTIYNTKIILYETLKNINKKVCIWSTVTIIMNNQEHTYIIWWHPSLKGRISYMSPLGKALLQQKEWSTIQFIIDKTTKDIHILSVR